MDDSMLHPPLSVQTFRGTVLHQKMRFTAMVLKWSTKWLAEVQDMSVAAACDGLALAKQIRRFAYGLEKSFEEAAVAELLISGTPYHQGEGYLAFVRPGTDRKGWKHEAVMTALIEQKVEHARAKFPYLPEEAIRSLVNEAMWSVHRAGRIEWRATDLRRVGLDPDDFSTRTPEAPTLDVRGEATYVDEVTRRPRGIPKGA